MPNLATVAAILTAIVATITMLVMFSKQTAEAGKREARLTLLIEQHEVRISTLIVQQKDEIKNIYNNMEREFDRKRSDHNKDIVMLKDQIIQIVQRFDIHCSSNHVQPLELRHVEETIREMSKDLEKHHELVHTLNNRTTALLDKILKSEGFDEWRKKNNI